MNNTFKLKPYKSVEEKSKQNQGRNHIHTSYLRLLAKYITKEFGKET